MNTNIVPVYERFESNGLELVVNTNTGKAYATQSAIIRMLETPKSTVVNALKGVPNQDIKTAEIQTQGGLQGCRLYSAETVFKLALKYNIDLAEKMGAAGANVYMLNLAGYKTKIVDQAEFNIPKTYSDALRLAATLSDQVDELTLKIETDKPKVLMAEEFLACKDTIDVREFGKLTKHITGLGPNQLLAKLRYLNILQSGNHKNQPYQKYIDLNYFGTREVVNRDNIYIVATITSTGQQWLINQIRR